MKTLSMRTRLGLTAALLGSQAAYAGYDTWFTPLTESAAVQPANSYEETAAPWVTPEGFAFKNVVSLREVEDKILSPDQSIGRAENAGTSASMFDMLAYDPSGNYIFIPHESPWAAGVSRYNVVNNHCDLIFAGDGAGINGDWSNDFGAFDPSRFTPNGTVFLAEEWTGLGRVVEIMNPFAPVEDIEWRVLESIANVAHEGINFSKKWEDTIYYIDEWNSGSIYKFVMSKKGDYTKGQTFVLSVDAFAKSGGVPEANWNQQADGVVREGWATWVPLTDEDGTPLPGITDPFRDGPTNDPRSSDVTRGGRPAADDAGGTPYGRPEDMAVGRLRNGNEVLYVTTTSENKVISIEIRENRRGRRATPSGRAIVRTFADNVMPKNKGFDPTSGQLNSPDNLAIDALGGIYIIEDAPNGSLTGGDIWYARDTNNNGVAESLDHFMSIRVAGSEATGMIWNPEILTEFAVAVQHPASTDLDNVPDGLGDAVWLFDVSGVNERFVQYLDRYQGPFGE